MNNLGLRIKELREEQNISQDYLAFELNISQNKLSKIENGKLNVSLSFLIVIFQYFDLVSVDVVELLKDF